MPRSRSLQKHGFENDRIPLIVTECARGVIEVKKKFSASIIPLLSVLVLSIFASTYLIPTVSANEYKYEYWVDIYLDCSVGFPPTIIGCESNLEWMEKLSWEGSVEIIDEGVLTLANDVRWCYQIYVVYEELVVGYELLGSFKNYFSIYWKLPWDFPYPTENYGYQWFTDGTGYFKGIEGSGEVWVEWHELELPPDDPFRLITCQHSWGTVNLGDYYARAQELIETIETWSLHKGTKNSLASKLERALHHLDTGRESGAVNKLIAFINQVEGLRGKKLANDQTDHLIAEAQLIIDLIKG